MMPITTITNNPKTRARATHPQLRFRSILMGRDIGVTGWLTVGGGETRRAAAVGGGVLPLRERLAGSYAAGETRVLPMSTSSTRRGKGMLFSSSAMCSGGVGVRRGACAL